MANKCIYCDGDIIDERAVSVCDKCGEGVWGRKMFRAIVDEMSGARERGDLEQGNVE